MNSMKDLWDSVLKRLSHELSETTINTWFDEVTVVTMEDSAFVLHCSNTFKKSTIEARFLPHIKAALRDLFSTDLEVKILDDQQLSAYHGVAPDRPGSLLESDAFTFGTYVVGPQNKMAYAAARAVAEKPAEHYNPLFIYGDSGLGKTHLLYAIAHQVRQRQPQPDARRVLRKAAAVEPLEQMGQVLRVDAGAGVHHHADAVLPHEGHAVGIALGGHQVFDLGLLHGVAR